MSRRAVNAPGVAGYVLGVLASSLMFGTLFMLPRLQPYDFWDACAVLVVYVPLCAGAAATVGAVVWVPSVAVLDAVNRRTGHQGVHVLVAGTMGAAMTLVFMIAPLLDDPHEGEPYYLVASVGISAALGRAALIPLVAFRRRQAARGQLTGASRW